MSIPTTTELKNILKQHTVDAWFPHCLDTQHGGFYCDFDRRWRPSGPHEKLLEFQSRQTWIAADIFSFSPGDDRLRQAALHGFRYLRDVMWDHYNGGWFHRLARTGDPLEFRTKHAHGIAYAIGACVAVHNATGESGALNLAQEGFNWLDKHAHDPELGGYFGFMMSNGELIQTPDKCPWTSVCDTIETPIGLKDANVHSDLLETLTDLYRVWPNPSVDQRLRELVQLICELMINPKGALWHLFLPDWSPVPYITHWGTAFQTVHRLLALRDLMEEEMAATITTCAFQVLDTALEYGYDRDAGCFNYAGPAIPITQLQGHDLIVRNKAWWVQCEAFKALWMACVTREDNRRYKDCLQSLWGYLLHHMLDSKYGGIYPQGLESLPNWQTKFNIGLTPETHVQKGNPWKDAAHDGWAWLYCASNPLPN